TSRPACSQLKRKATTPKSPLLMVHSQDHLMNAITFRDLAGEIVALYNG
ncbi:PTS system cellobiose-specific transporter subunit IIA, partial [Lacticaseibacillus rhamnosus MTCC 5462]